jgi:hypothetical protein
MARHNLEERAEKTLRDTEGYRVPVPIHLVAQRLNLTLEAAALGDKVSGMLVVDGDQEQSVTTRPMPASGSGSRFLTKSPTISCMREEAARRNCSLISR